MKKLYTTIALLFVIIINAQQGDLDPTFGTNGIINIASFLNPQKMIFQPDGKILVSGYKNNVAKMVRLNTDGTLDTTFGTLGFINCNDVRSIDLQANGKILTSGSAAYRFNTDGSPDLTFNNNTGFTDYISFLKVLDDQSIITLYQSSNFTRQLGKLSANGVPDTTFNGGNQATINGQFPHVGINVLANNKFVLSTDTYLQYRRNANGTIDIDYSGGNPYNVSDAKTVVNSLYLAGQDGSIGSSNFTIYKYNLAGTLDTSYSTDGITATNFNSNIKNYPYSINVQPSGKIIVVGKTGDFTTGSIAITRFNTDGSLDTTFGTGGKTTTTTNTLPEQKTLSALSPTDNKLYVIAQNNTIGNIYTEDFMIARYTTGSNNLSTNNSSNLQSFSISPNPTNNTLNITTQETINSIKIIDIAGRNTNITNFENNKIDVSNLQNGIYLLEIATENGLQTQKFIKN